MGWTIYVRDANRNRVAEVDDYQRLELALRFSDVSAWTLHIPANTAVATELLKQGAGVEIVKDGTTVLSGPRTRRLRQWSADEDRLELSGPDDTVWLARRLAYPEAPALTTATDAYDVRTGVCETIMRQFVDVNAGPSADSTRRVSGLTLAADGTRGTSVTGRGRFHTLLELFQNLALAGGDLGFRIVQSGTDLEFQVYEPSDKTATVIFSEEFGNLRSFDYFEQAASANFAVVGGGGEGAARTFTTGGDSSSINTWGRIETFVDQRHTTDATELAQARDETLDQESSRTGLRIEPVDTGAVTYLTDYTLGDKVTVVVDGVSIQDVVREVHLTLDVDGEAVAPTVGTPRESDPRVPQFFRQLARLRRDVSNLERR